MNNDFLGLVYKLAVYLVQIIELIWPLLVLVFAWRFGTLFFGMINGKVYESYSVKKRLKKMGDGKTREELLHAIRTLNPKEFEYYVADIFTKNGFKVKVIGGHGEGDGGIDIIATKNDKKYFVQCKKFIGKDIGVSQVREFYGAISDQLHKENGGMGYFVTTTFFTEKAREFATHRKISLFDGDGLLDLVYRQENKGKEVAPNGLDYSEALKNIPPICPACKRQLAWRKGPHGDFVGCTGFPSCRYVFGGRTFDQQ